MLSSGNPIAEPSTVAAAPGFNPSTSTPKINWPVTSWLIWNRGSPARGSFAIITSSRPSSGCDACAAGSVTLKRSVPLSTPPRKVRVAGAPA